MSRTPGTSLRIAVLSDLHIDRAVDESSWDLAKAALRAALALRPDHIVIAGDLFDCARAMHEDRDAVRRYLRGHGLWHRDRLTIVVGNHDVFETPERTRRGLARLAIAKPGVAYEAFCAWAGELAHAADRLAGEDDLYPLEKRLGDVCLWAADSTSNSVLTAANGYWRKDDDALLRASASSLGRGVRRVLALHHAPFQDEEQTRLDILKRIWRLGFPPGDYRRLHRFLATAAVDTLLCGHIHGGGEPWSEHLGRRGAWSHCLGRTHDLYDNEPLIGVLDVRARGVARWATVAVE